MDRRTTGIVATLAATALCGLPGLVCFCFGLSPAIMSQDPGWMAESAGDNSVKTLTTLGLISILLAVLMIAIPIIVALIFFRRKTPQPISEINEPLPPPS